MKKYEMTEETLTFNDRVLHRIRAVRDFGTIKAGDEGGWIEKQENLSHDECAWVREDARVYEDAHVCGNALVYGNALVCGNAQVCGNARVRENAKVYGNAYVYGHTYVHGDARVHGNAQAYGNAEISENAQVYGNTDVHGDTKVYGDARVCENACVCESAEVHGNARVHGNSWVYRNAKVYGNAEAHGNAEVCLDAEVYKKAHLMYVACIGSRDGTTTFFRTKSGDVAVKCGCFYGDISSFEKAVKRTHHGTKHEKVYMKAIELAKLQIQDEKKENENRAGGKGDESFCKEAKRDHGRAETDSKAAGSDDRMQ